MALVGGIFLPNTLLHPAGGVLNPAKRIKSESTDGRILPKSIRLPVT